MSRACVGSHFASQFFGGEGWGQLRLSLNQLRAFLLNTIRYINHIWFRQTSYFTNFQFLELSFSWIIRKDENC